MFKHSLKILIVLLTLGVFGGIYYAYTYGGFSVEPSRLNFRAVNKLIPETVSDIISQDTRIIYEREYTRSNAVIISGLENAERLIGKKLDEVKKEFTEEQGFSIKFVNGDLIIHQKIDDWTAQDKNKYRLKEYKNFLAVYQGPDPEHDSLVRVTPLQFSRMPQTVQEAVKRGEYEFKTEEELNDALENLDEYI